MVWALIIAINLDGWESTRTTACIEMQSTTVGGCRQVDDKGSDQEGIYLRANVGVALNKITKLAALCQVAMLRKNWLQQKVELGSK